MSELQKSLEKKLPRFFFLSDKDADEGVVDPGTVLAWGDSNSHTSTGSLELISISVAHGWNTKQSSAVNRSKKSNDFSS
jgi:hypothetical protein